MICSRKELRGEFARAGLYVVNVVSGPGAGKTELLARTLSLLRDRGYRVAAIVGDLATDYDAKRLATSGAPTRQIITGTVCHLEAGMVRTALEDWNLAELDFLFIENVGNLVCPASFDLGEHLRVLLFPVTEGEDKPLKYPTLINTADVTLISKIDLAQAVGFDEALAGGTSTKLDPGPSCSNCPHEPGKGWRPGSSFWSNGAERPSTWGSVPSIRRLRTESPSRCPRERPRDCPGLFDQRPTAGAGAVADSGEDIEPDMLGLVRGAEPALPGWERWAIARGHARLDPCCEGRACIPTRTGQSPRARSGGLSFSSAYSSVSAWLARSLSDA